MLKTVPAARPDSPTSYTEAVAHAAASRRRGEHLMPTSRVVDTLCRAASIPYGAACVAGLLVPGFALVPLFLLARQPAARNRSTAEGGSLSAIKTLNARAVMARVGIGPDYLAPNLMQPLSLTGDNALGKLYTQALAASVVWGFRFNRRLWLEQAMRPLLGNFVRFVDLSYLQMRTCWLDDVVTQFVDDLHGKPGQLVILGAGYDTRCLRLGAPAGLTAFEVDAAGTQQAKRALMQRVGIDDTSVKYVSCDFVSEDWQVKLQQAGFDAKRPTCFVWEGVTMYLPESVVQETLKKVSKLAAGSVIAFDCIDAEWLNQPMLKKLMERSAEPMYFGLDAAQIEPFVNGCSLQIIDNLRYETLLQRYMPTDTRGRTLAACSDFGAYVAARNA